MNRQQFIQYMRSPEELSIEDSNSISLLTKEFPYFQTAQILYTKSLHSQNSIHYNHQLKVAAAYSPDRKVLFELIMHKNNLREKTAQESSIEIPIGDTEILEALSFVSNTTEDIESKKEIKESVIEQEQLKQVEAVEKANPAHLSRFEQEIIKEAISASIGLEVSDQESIKEAKGIKVKEEFSEELKREDPTTPAKESTHSFNEWLKISHTSGEKEEIKEDNKKKGKNKFSDLINKFIEEEPRIASPKAEFFSPVNMARQSVVEDGVFISETLAKIYVQQGNILKAIKAYESLSLKYPKKKLYFAAQIKSLKKIIQQQK